MAKVPIANAHQHADLFWGIKGGGGGSLGVVTRLTLRTHKLPELLARFSVRSGRRPTRLMAP